MDNTTLNIIGYAMLLISGGMLHDVPFPRFLSAFLLIMVGSALTLK